MSQAPHERIKLPPGWWDRFVELYQRSGFATLEDFCRATGQAPDSDSAIAPRTMYRCKNSKNPRGQITARVSDILFRKLGFETRSELVASLEQPAQPRGIGTHGEGLQPAAPPKVSARTTRASPRTTAFPRRVLTTKHGMPQWADHWEVPLNGGCLRSFTCAVESSSPYFRFGLKLLTSDGRVFGDAAIVSQDGVSLLIHIGRNNSDRPGMSSGDVFFTTYRNGFAANRDQKLCASKARLQATVNLSIEDGSAFSFSVNGHCCCRGAIRPEACYRLVMFGWGDREEFEIKVSEVEVSTLK